jgi:phage tail sheath protein FI
MLSPSLNYKTKYTTSDITTKTYLGLNKIELDLMKFIGNIQTVETTTKTKGFHLDSGVDTTIYDTGIGSFNAIDTQNINNVYYKKVTRKFTIALAGGFDGWDIFRTSRSNTDKFKNIENSDYNAYLRGIQTFADTEDYHIDLFCTPNINFSDNTYLVEEAITLVENRSDCFYVVDAPYLSNSTNIANQVIGLLETTDIDTSYASTYFGYIGISDPNTNKNLFIPPTGEVLRIMALTDKTTKPWFAPAGTNRGLIYNSSNLIKNFNLSERDSLQLGRINPIISTENYGINVFGQRTLFNGTNNNLLTKINVRKLLNYIKKEIKDIALSSLFEQNNQTNVNNFLNKTKILLSNIQKQQGLNKYDLTVDDYNNTPENIDRGLMFFILNLYPISATEGIGINFTINPSDNIITFTNS